MVLAFLLISITLVLMLVSKKINIGFALISGALLLSLLMKKEISFYPSILYKTFTDPLAINLILSITFISILGYLMDHYGLTTKMINALEELLGSTKLTILLSPALIGTLLVTGGALMSCPIVDNLGDKIDLENDKKASINMIFRHALYFIYPLSPTIVLATQLANINLWDFIKVQAPIALIMYILGYFLLVNKATVINKKTDSSKQAFKSNFILFLINASPIIISTLGVILFDLPFFVSLVIGIGLTIILGSKEVSTNFIQDVINGIKPSVILAISGILIFKNVINSIDDLYIILEDLIYSGIPVELIIIVAALFIALPLASTQAGIGILYPLILPLATTYNMRLSYAMFIYVSSFMFYYISPLHMCQVLTLDYFNVKLKHLYKNYLLLLPATYCTMLIIYFIFL